MAKTARIRSDDLISTLKALFPIFAGAGFLALVIYIASIYNYQNDLNTYFVLNEDRNSLQNEYNEGFDSLIDDINSLAGKNSEQRLEILSEIEQLNLSLIELTNQMIVDGYKIIDLDVKEKSEFDFATNELNFLRTQLHIKISEYIERQQFAVNYLKLKTSTENCYNKIDLNSSNYAKIVTALNKCSDSLTEQIEYINSSDFDSETFKGTSNYLDKYETYWSLVKQMYNLLTREKDEQAKKMAEGVKSQLKKLPDAQKASQAELNTVLSENLQTEVNEILSEITKKSEEIKNIEGTSSF